MKNRMISIPFFLLRATTAGAALVTGLLQTFVFAHVLSPHRFSVFILVAAIGYSLWLIDFGIVKILFVRLRARFLGGDKSDEVAGHASAVVLFYFALVVSGSLACFAVMATGADASWRESAEFARRAERRQHHDERGNREEQEEVDERRADDQPFAQATGYVRSHWPWLRPAREGVLLGLGSLTLTRLSHSYSSMK
jgi:hypothetical protein